MKSQSVNVVVVGVVGAVGAVGEDPDVFPFLGVSAVVVVVVVVDADNDGCPSIHPSIHPTSRKRFCFPISSAYPWKSGAVFRVTYHGL